MKKILMQTFFNRPTLVVARGLLGKYLVRRIPARGGQPARTLALMLTEVEAYDGPHDLASHASRGRKTPRNVHMFGNAGRFYVYFTYGMHWLVNVVTGPKDYPAAVLLRAGAYQDLKTKQITPVTGPARLTKFMHIDKAQNGKLATRATGLWFEDRGIQIPARAVSTGKRVGVDYAGPVWASKRYNFKI